MQNEFDAEKLDSNGGAPLSRQVTVAITPEQYERLFFNPVGVRGDLSKRLGNPTLLGLIGFLVPYTSTILILIGFQGAVAPTSLIGLTGDYYFLGCIAMTLAGIAEFILGNTFPFAVFCTYGIHWGALAYAQDPNYNLLKGFVSSGVTLTQAAGTAEWASSQGFHNVAMCLVSFSFFLATFRINILFVLVFFGLVFLFAFIAAANFATPAAAIAAAGGDMSGLQHVSNLLKIAGSFGFIGLACGWYLTIITACNATGIPCPLPVFDLSTRVFPGKKDKAGDDKSV